MAGDAGVLWGAINPGWTPGESTFPLLKGEPTFCSAEPDDNLRLRIGVPESASTRAATAPAPDKFTGLAGIGVLTKLLELDETPFAATGFSDISSPKSSEKNSK